MKVISIVYFSGSGHTGKVAQAVEKGAASVEGTTTKLISISGNDINKGRYMNHDVIATLDTSDAIIFGSPTYMGRPATQFKAFTDTTVGSWVAQKWRDKLVGGFTISGVLSGDKLSILQYFHTLAMEHVCREFHSTTYVASLMKDEGLKSFGHGIGASFNIGPIRVKLTPADHAWQNSVPEERRKRVFKDEDACGFLIETPDGTIWAPGDSRLMPEHLRMPAPDAIFFDFSDNRWHFGLEGAVKLANTYPNTPLLLSHWGTVDDS